MSSTLCDTCDKDSRYMAAVAENAKLRELVADLCDECCDPCDLWKFRDRMRELGIEVDE